MFFFMWDDEGIVPYRVLRIPKHLKSNIYNLKI